MNYSKKQSGSALYLTVVFVGLILVVVIGATNIVVMGSNLVKGVGDSTKAFYIADTGIEKTLYEVLKQDNKGGGDCSEEFDSTYGSVDCTVIVTEDGADTYIRSNGGYNGSERRIEAAY